MATARESIGNMIPDVVGASVAMTVVFGISVKFGITDPTNVDGSRPGSPENIVISVGQGGVLLGDEDDFWS